MNKKIKGKKVLVYGLGGSGQAACKLLHAFGACVSVYDDDKKFRNLFCYVDQPLLHKYDLVVVSPGVKVVGNSLISALREQKANIISEIDLGSIFSLGKLIAITGTNGKTTTCALLGKIFDEAGKKNFVCGNIGLPISSIALKTDKKSFVICETSNFQLELSKLFSPQIACVLNIQPDHLDRHGSFDEYKRVKAKIFQNFKALKSAVINLDDDGARDIAPQKKSVFYSFNPLKKGVCVKNGSIYSGKTRIISLDEIPLIGSKNISNVMAAVAIALLCKIKPRCIRSAIASFVPPAHRLQFVTEKNGVIFIDDSKSTNISCVEMALDSIKSKNIILMLGGQNKGLNFEKLFAAKPQIKKVICFGEAASEIDEVAKRYGYDSQSFATLKEATYFVKGVAQSGDTVLLSPGCTSFDEFASYAVRGQIFAEIVSSES